MKRRFSSVGLVLCGLLLAGAAGLKAQDRDWDRDDDARWQRGNGYGYGYDRGDAVQRTLYDLDRAYSNSRTDHHERGKFEEARRNLMAFQDHWSRGDFDKGKLDEAIENVHHLADSHHLDPRDRRVLEQDLFALRDFRSNRGFGYRR